MPTVEPPRACGGGSGSIRATEDGLVAAPWSARRGVGGSQWTGRPSLSVRRGGGSSWPLSGSTARPSTSAGGTIRSRSAMEPVPRPARSQATLAGRIARARPRRRMGRRPRTAVRGASGSSSEPRPAETVVGARRTVGAPPGRAAPAAAARAAPCRRAGPVAAARPIPSTRPCASACSAARASAGVPSPTRRKNSANPPSASRSRRTMTESYVSSALATRSTSGRGNPSA